MKYLILASLLVVGCSGTPALAEKNPEAQIEARQKLEELAALPVGLEVSHSPGPVHATLFSPSLSGVRWKHATTVSSLVGPVKILEFGYFVERNGRWERPYGVEVPYVFTTKDFAEKYACPDSELKTGQSYQDPRNRSVIDCVPEQVAKWYFIGLDSQGNRVKGEAKLKLLAEVVNDGPPTKLSQSEDFDVVSFKGFRVLIPVEYYVDNIEIVSDRVVVTAHISTAKPNGMHHVDSLVWYFPNYLPNKDIIPFSERRMILEISSDEGEGFRQASRTVSILDATAVYVRYWEGGNVRLFDERGKEIPVSWPKVIERGRPIIADYLEPLTWITQSLPGERVHELVCSQVCEGGSTITFVVYTLETGEIQQIPRDELSVEFLLNILQYLKR